MIRPTTWVLAALFIAGVVLAGACAVARLTPSQRLVRSKCGACHVRPAPGDHPRVKLVRVLNNHRRRFTLTGAQTKQILDQLAPAVGSPP